MAVGAFDVTANVTYGIASTLGLLSIVSVAGSLYPVATVLLARFVHHERLMRVQQIGVVLALVGVGAHRDGMNRSPAVGQRWITPRGSGSSVMLSELMQYRRSVGLS